MEAVAAAAEVADDLSEEATEEAELVTLAMELPVAEPMLLAAEEAGVVDEGEEPDEPAEA